MGDSRVNRILFGPALSRVVGQSTVNLLYTLSRKNSAPWNEDADTPLCRHLSGLRHRLAHLEVALDEVFLPFLSSIKDPNIPGIPTSIALDAIISVLEHEEHHASLQNATIGDVTSKDVPKKEGLQAIGNVPSGANPGGTENMGNSGNAPRQCNSIYILDVYKYVAQEVCEIQFDEVGREDDAIYEKMIQLLATIVRNVDRISNNNPTDDIKGNALDNRPSTEQARYTNTSSGTEQIQIPNPASNRAAGGQSRLNKSHSTVIRKKKSVIYRIIFPFLMHKFHPVTNDDYSISAQKPEAGYFTFGATKKNQLPNTVLRNSSHRCLTSILRNITIDPEFYEATIGWAIEELKKLPHTSITNPQNLTLAESNGPGGASEKSEAAAPGDVMQKSLSPTVIAQLATMANTPLPTAVEERLSLAVVALSKCLESYTSGMNSGIRNPSIQYIADADSQNPTDDMIVEGGMNGNMSSNGVHPQTSTSSTTTEIMAANHSSLVIFDENEEAAAEDGLEKGVLLAQTCKLINEVAGALLAGLWRNNSLQTLLQLLPLCNECISISMRCGNTLWLEGFVVNVYQRLLTQGEKRFIVGDLILCVLEYFEEVLSVNPTIPRALHSIADALYYKPQYCIQLTKTVADLIRMLDTPMPASGGGGKLSRPSAFATYTLFYILKANADLSMQVGSDQRRQHLQDCIDKFAEKPKKAKAIFEPFIKAYLSGNVDFIKPPPLYERPLATQELLPLAYEDWAVKLAWLFRHCPFMPYHALGDYFGATDKDGTLGGLHCLAVYTAYFDFRGLDLGKAMRVFFESFMLPKEAQPIDKVLEVFSHIFYVQNCHQMPKRYASADACHVLAFSILLLNSDQHNAGVKKRMELADYKRNCRGENKEYKSDVKNDFDPDLLAAIFKEVKNVKMDTPTDGTFFSQQMGYRWKYVQGQDATLLRLDHQGRAPNSPISKSPTRASYYYQDPSDELVKKITEDGGEIDATASGKVARPVGLAAIKKEGRPDTIDENGECQADRMILHHENSVILRKSSVVLPNGLTLRASHLDEETEFFEKFSRQEREIIQQGLNMQNFLTENDIIKKKRQTSPVSGRGAVDQTVGTSAFDYVARPLNRLGFLTACGSDIFQAIIHVIQQDKTGVSPAFSCLENLWKFEDIQGISDRNSSCVSILFQEGINIFLQTDITKQIENANSKNLIPNALPNGPMVSTMANKPVTAAVAASAGGTSESVPGATGAQNASDKGVGKKEGGAPAGQQSGTQGTAGGGQTVNVATTYNSPSFGPAPNPVAKGIHHARLADMQFDYIVKQNSHSIKCLKTMFNFVSINANRMVTDPSFIVICIYFSLYNCWEEPQIPLYDPMLIPMSTNQPPPPQGVALSKTGTRHSQYILDERYIGDIMSMSVHSPAWDKFFSIGRNAFPIVHIHEQKTGGAWLLSKVVDVFGGATEDASGGNPAHQSSAPATEFDSGWSSEEEILRDGSADSVASGRGAGNTENFQPPPRGPSDKIMNSEAPIPKITNSPTSASATATKKRTFTSSANMKKTPKRNISTSGDPLAPLIEKAFHKCDPFNVFSKLDVRQLNLLATSILMAMLSTLRKGRDSDTGRNVNLEGGEDAGSSGPHQQVKPFVCPNHISFLNIGDGFEVLRFALRLSAKVAHNPIMQLRKAGKAVLELILCLANPNVLAATLSGSGITILSGSNGSSQAAATASATADTAGGPNSTAGSNQISVRTAALAIAAAFRFKDLWGDNGLAEILQGFLARNDSKKLFIQIGLVSCQAVQCFFAANSRTTISKLFKSSEEIYLVFRLLRNAYPSPDIIKQSRGLKIKKIRESLMLLLHPQLIPTIELTTFTNMLNELPLSLEENCRFLLALLGIFARYTRNLNRSQGNSASSTPGITPSRVVSPANDNGSSSNGHTGAAATGGAVSGVANAAPQAFVTAQATQANNERMANFWAATLVILCQKNLTMYWNKLSVTPTNEQTDVTLVSFAAMLKELQDNVLHEGVQYYAPYVGVQALDKLLGFLMSVSIAGPPQHLLTRCLSIGSQFFLVNLQKIARKSKFDQVWLMVLRQIITLNRIGKEQKDEILMELSLENLKNILRIMLNSKLLTFSSGEPGKEARYIEVTWNNIEQHFPGFIQELKNEQQAMEEFLKKKQEAPAGVPTASGAPTPPSTEASSKESPKESPKPTPTSTPQHTPNAPPHPPAPPMQPSPPLQPQQSQGSPSVQPQQSQGSPSVQPQQSQGSPPVQPQQSQGSPSVQPQQSQGSPPMQPQGTPNMQPHQPSPPMQARTSVPPTSAPGSTQSTPQMQAQVSPSAPPQPSPPSQDQPGNDQEAHTTE